MKKSLWIVAAALPLLLTACGDESGGTDLGAVAGKPATQGPDELPSDPDTLQPSPVVPPSPTPPPTSASPAPSGPDTENTEIKREDAPPNIDCKKIVAADAAPLSSPATSGTEVAFGKAYSWPGKLTVSVSTPKAYNPTPQAAGVDGEGKVAMRMTITIRNDASAAYSMSDPWEQLSSGDVESSSQIFDLGQCMEGSPSSNLAKGKQASYMVAFVIKDPNSIKLSFDPGNDLEPIAFTN